MRPILLAPLLAAALAAPLAHAADQTRSVPAFTAVSNTGPISVSIEVGKAQSVVASGNDAFLEQLVTEVVDGELRVRMRNKVTRSIEGDPRVTITVPQLVRYAMAGAGETTITHASGDALDISMAGAGSLKASGEVKTLKLTMGGVGEVDTRALHADNVSASVGGVGSVKLWAGQRLDASVGGVGSLTYYGDPKTVNTSGGGLGSISRGK